MRFFLILLLACLSAAAQEAPPDLLVDAGQCLGTARKDWLDLAHNKAATVELGSATDAAAHPDEQMLYLVDYIAPLHSQGTVFSFLVGGDKHHRFLRLLFPTRFRQSFWDDGSWRIELLDPPYGGVGTHDEISAAIRQSGFESTFKIPIAQLQKPPDSVSCEMENQLP